MKADFQKLNEQIDMVIKQVTILDSSSAIHLKEVKSKFNLIEKKDKNLTEAVIALREIKKTLVSNKVEFLKDNTKLKSLAGKVEEIYAGAFM